MTKIRLAGIVVEVDNRYPYFEELCRDYIVSGCPAALNVRVSSEEIAAENKSQAEDYPDDYLEGLAVYRRIAENMPRFDGFLMHGAVISCKDKGIIFTAPSGTGKTTHVMYWKQTFGDDCVIVNGDKPIVRLENGVWYAYGTPWQGKENLGMNTRVRLTDMLVVSRAEENRVNPLRAAEALRSALEAAYRPSGRDAYRTTLELLDRFVRDVRIQRLCCTLSPDAAKAALEGIS